jgi:oligogalacturonide transporter
MAISRNTGEKSMLQPPKKLKLISKIGYGMGDIYGGGATTIINMYYLFFLVDIVGISPSLAGFAFLISKMWDAVTDPFMGIITDNTRTRFGRRRPYFLAGIILIFLSFVIMWIPPEFNNQALRFGWVLFSYIVFSTVYTMVWVPYNALSAELSDDYKERTRLSTYRMAFSNLAGILGATLPMDLFVNGIYKGDASRGFAVMGISFGLLFSLPFIVTFFTCRENPDFQNLPRRKIGNIKEFMFTQFIRPFEVKPFRYVVFMYLFGFMAQDAVLALTVYLMTYALEIPSMMTLLVPVYGSLLISLVLVNILSVKIGKRRTFMLAAAIWIMALMTVPFMGPGMAIWRLYLFGILFGFGLAGVQVMVFASFPDVPDADELVNGERREGLFSGIFAFLRKAGSAFTLFIIGVLIEFAGYAPPVDGINQVQSSQFISILTIVFILLPGIYLTFAIISAWKYPLNGERLGSIREILHIKRLEKPLSEELKIMELKLITVIGGRKNG